IDNRSGREFGPHSATSLSAIRLRFNMNAVRLPVNVFDASEESFFQKLAVVVRRANSVDLMMILAAKEPGAAMPTRKSVEFWSRCAAYFKDYPNVIFDAFSNPLPAAVPRNLGDAHSAGGWRFWRSGGGRRGGGGE